MNKVYGLILASGTGNRIASHIPKQFIKVAGKTILEHTIEIFERNRNIDEIIIVVHPLFRQLIEAINLENKYKKIKKILNGGKTRRESSFIGISSIEDEDSFVLIHDAVRPFVSHRIINECLEALNKYNAVAVAIPAIDTVIKINDSMLIEDIPDRKYIMRVQTPQGFNTEVIKQAHRQASEDEIEATDDCGLVLRYKCAPIYIVRGEERNIKITYPEDLLMAEKFFERTISECQEKL